MQTVGNDFVLVKAEDLGGRSLSEFAQATADRRFSVGHDGLMVMSREDYGAKLRFFNPDGSEDFCGNALRCAGLFCEVEGWASGEFEVEQLGQRVPVTVKNGLVTAEMPAASYEPDFVPSCADEELVDAEIAGVTGSALSTGSTHFVTYVDDLPKSPWFEEVSRKIENDPVFPMRTTVMWARKDGERLYSVRIWERGVGETLGCGTGSLAVAADVNRRFGTTGEIVVSNPGGDLKVEVEDWRKPMLISSRPEIVFRGEFPV